ncbi:MAG: ABC transporter substrate-binding protein [Desulfurococcales archaeon]|nr:ABC transporter substrate-binding protein [Desulfurococcales archaeon]
MKEGAVITAVVILALILGATAMSLTYYETQTLRSELTKQSQNLKAISEGLQEVKAELNTLKSSVSDVRSRVGSIGSDVASLQSRIESLASELSNLKAGESSLQDEVASLKEEVKLAKYPMTLTDALGRTVTLYRRPEKIVSVVPSFTEILFLIGAGKNVVGVDQFSNYPPVVNQLKKNGSLKVVGGFSTINIEALLKLKPDLVIMTGGVQDRYVKELSDMGVPVIVLKSGSISDIFSDIMILGALTDHEGEALKLVEWMRNTIIQTHEAVVNYLNKTGGKEVKVYYELFPDYWTMGRNSYITDMISLAGGENIFGNITKYYFVASPEAVIAANPDVIIINYNYGQFGSPDTLVHRIASRSGWGNVTAVREGRIYVMQGAVEDIMVRPGPRAALGVAILARIFYSHAFGLESVPEVINETVLQSWGLTLPKG